mgnify:FL=1|tara:strand:- start:2791 stop:3153 length:363 start_codon:yes stop_codon:yes gene_type:complete
MQDSYIEEANYYDNLKVELGYETVWDMGDTKHSYMTLGTSLFTDKPRLVTYKCIKEMGANFDETVWITFTAVAENGTVGALWKAAESCYQQAKLVVGDWHYFVEDFEMNDEGHLEMVTGS